MLNQPSQSCLKKISIIGIIFSLLTLLLIGRLFFWQITSGPKLASLAKLQYLSDVKVKAKRGSILSSDEDWLVASVDAWLLYINTKELKNSPAEIANAIAPFLVKKEEIKQEIERIQNVLEKNQNLWVPIKQKIDTTTKTNIENLKIPGIGFEKDETRYYPEGSSSAQLLGFVGKDKEGKDVGYFGLEGYYDLPLSGRPGFITSERGALGAPILFGSSKEVSAKEGVDLVTHIDKGIQLLVEQKLKDGIDTYGAKSGTVIIINPYDGAIMAMASYPSFDPAKYYDSLDDNFRNPAISDSFEPGSIFKPIVMAAGIDSGVIKIDTRCDICDGPYKIDKYYIETWDQKYFKDETMVDVIVHSDNVGMTFVGLKLGTKKLVDYLEKFGLNKETGIDLQGEQKPQFRDKNSWNIVDTATATFGQGIAITPIQMVRAMSAIANGGYLIRPHVVHKIKSQGLVEEINEKDPVRIISDNAATDTKEMMIAAVKYGEAKWAVPKGFKIAGKTGTAQIPIGGHYDAEKTIASFIGFAPADKPKFLMLVSLREPQTSQWGSETAAPLWFSIAKDLFPYLGIQPEN
jgi:cell division protein FtsI/penicillin-binding protein 2